MWLAVLFLAVVILFAVDKLRKNGKAEKYNLPPGPKGLPILGTFPSFLKAPAHIVFQEWTKAYGKIYRFTLGTGTSVVLGDADTVREAMLTKSPAVDSRCQWRYCFITTFRGLSVLPYSQKWMNTRRRTLTILRDFGMGKSFMEDRIYEETLRLIKCMLDNGGNGEKNFEPRNMLRRSPVNTLCWILFGKRYDYDHPGLLYVMDTVETLVNILATASIYDILPSWLRRILGFSLRSFHKQLQNLNKFMHDRVDEHRKTYNEKDTNNFVDAWLKARDADKAKNTTNIHARVPSSGRANDSGEEKEFSELPDVLQDVIIAGAHSTGIVFHWTVLLLVLHKDVQDKAYKEITEIIGADQVPSMAHRSKLRYIDALINEVLRVSTVLPLVAHATGKDTTIAGYDVPGNIEVIYNNWTLNHDEKRFPDPFCFNPDRWLDEEGKLRKDLLRGFFPFGLGKRSCAGESLARMQLFITTVTLIQHLEFLPPDATASEDLKPVVHHEFGMLATCKPFVMRAKKRPNSTALV
ncbi:cytochrome P450 2B11-like [Clavelina lepadiformis]|uniref:cytochrome P450 2B11-like n=1 Tax=Clavelina lepadiformis TaxID=159417 RepID=UPI00404127AF